MTNLDKYPNLQAILSGTVAGSFRDWIAVRPELEKLVVEMSGLAAHQCQHPAGDEFGNAYCTKIKKLEASVKSWEHVAVGNVGLITTLQEEVKFYKAEADSQGEINSKTHAHYQERIDELETELGIRKRTTEFQEKAYLENHGGSWGECKYKTRINGMEEVLRKVQQWGADARSADSYEVFQAVKLSLIDPAPSREVKVVDCTCRVCVCYGDHCLGCGARTCVAHELAHATGGGK